MPYDILRVSPWFTANFRITLFMRGSAKLTIQNNNGKRVNIYLDHDQTDKLIKDAENTVNPVNPGFQTFHPED